MSVVIIGGNERMVCQYTDICRDFGCKAKVFAKENGPMKKKIGCPDLLILFTQYGFSQDGDFRFPGSKTEPNSHCQSPHQQRGCPPVGFWSSTALNEKKSQLQRKNIVDI